MDNENKIPPLNVQKTPVVDYNSVKQNDEQKKGEQNDNDKIKQAHEQADEDISKDADLSIHSPNDDLDEGETARLGEDETDLV
ncbi:MAG: hypothetical protein ACTHJ5_11045 [Ilyomonas sp.]